jgi:hypothetical protein
MMRKLLLAGLVLLLPATSQAKEVYVSKTTGDDSSSGTKDKPKKLLCVQRRRAGGRTGGVSGRLRRGDRPQLGDSVWMVLNADGALVKDAYYFTGQDGTAGGGTLDRTRGLAVHNGQLVVMGNIYTNDTKYSGTWRTPASRDIAPAFGPSSDVIMQSFNPGTLEDLSSVAPRTEAELTALSLSDVTSNMVATTPAAADGAARATQGYVFWFNGVL